jgi:hypothetical protein
MHLPLLQCVIGFCIPRLGFALPQARNPAGPGLRCGSLVPRRCPVPTPHSTMPSYPRYRQNSDFKNERHNVQRFSDLLVLLSKWARFGFIHGWPFSDCSVSEAISRSNYKGWLSEWLHPITGQWVQFGLPTVERWSGQPTTGITALCIPDRSEREADQAG